MTSRILPRDEWHRLNETPLSEHAISLMDAKGLQIVVVEDGSQIVACWAVLPVLHLEGAWIRPDRRKSPSIARRLMAAVGSVLKPIGANWVLTGAQDEPTRQLLQHFGAAKVPMDTYMISMKGPICRFLQ